MCTCQADSTHTLEGFWRRLSQKQSLINLVAIVDRNHLISIKIYCD